MPPGLPGEGNRNPWSGQSSTGRRRRNPQTTDSRHGYGVAPNVAWCGDITYLWTEEGWLYVSVLLDLYARQVVGWSMRDHAVVEPG